MPMAENEVVLVAPEGGGETTVTTAAAFVNLVYGQGYTPQSGSIEDAYYRLVPHAED